MTGAEFDFAGPEQAFRDAVQTYVDYMDGNPTATTRVTHTELFAPYTSEILSLRVGKANAPNLWIVRPLAVDQNGNSLPILVEQASEIDEEGNAWPVQIKSTNQWTLEYALKSHMVTKAIKTDTTISGIQPAWFEQLPPSDDDLNELAEKLNGASIEPQHKSLAARLFSKLGNIILDRYKHPKLV